LFPLVLVLLTGAEENTENADPRIERLLTGLKAAGWQKASDELVSIGDPAVDPLSTAFDKAYDSRDEHSCLTIVDILRRIGTKRALEILVEKRVKIDIDPKNVMLVTWIERALQRISVSSDGLPWIMELLEDDKPAERRVAASILLASLIEEKTRVGPTVDLLLKRYDEEKDDLVKRRLIVCMGYFDDRRTYDILMEELASDNENYNWAALSGLWVRNETDSACADRVSGIVADKKKQHRLRFRAAEILHMVDKERWRKLMFSLLQESDSETRGLAHGVIRFMKCDACIPPLVEALEDPQSYDRNEIVKTLGIIGEERVLSILEQLRDNSDPEVRNAAVNAINRIKAKTGM
jgi:HEAT repeat protein